MKSIKAYNYPASVFLAIQLTHDPILKLIMFPLIIPAVFQLFSLSLLNWIFFLSEIGIIFMIEKLDLDFFFFDG